MTAEEISDQSEDPLGQTPPPQLYRYCPFDTHTLRTLITNEIYFARPEQFNDPYELAYIFKPEPPEKRIQSLSHFIKELLKTKDPPKISTSLLSKILSNVIQTNKIFSGTHVKNF